MHIYIFFRESAVKHLPAYCWLLSMILILENLKSVWEGKQMVWIKEELGDKETYDKGVHCFLWGNVAESLLSRWEGPIWESSVKTSQRGWTSVEP